MDLDIIQSTKEGEITQFLCDVRDYFKAALATSEYENTSNMFYLTAEDATQQLLQRCEQLLNRLGNKRHNSSLPNTKTVTNGLETHQWYQHQKDNLKKQQQQQQQLHHPPSHISSNTAINGASQSQLDEQQQQHMAQQNPKHQPDDVSYLDMSAAINSQKHSLPSNKGSLDKMSTSIESDKTFRCSTLIVKQNKSFLHRLQETMTTTTDEVFDENDGFGGQLDDEFKDDSQIYDICQVTTQGSDGEEDELAQEETLKAITPDSHLSLPNIGCPFMDLPAGHLSIQKSTKYGQLQRIEKRLFFDQSKKCYCGVINDWLLCYADGPTSNRPSNTLYLKIPGVEIEHFGEGKRRDICFQVSTPDPSKRFVFQAVNEIDAKEWIHAIEAAIRGGISGTGGKTTTTTTTRSSASRKLPTPPVMKKITFLSTFQKGKDIKSASNAMTASVNSSDCIYEEPSPVYHAQEISNEGELAIPPVLPLKQNSPLAMAHRFEYDVPKCPPQPLICQNQDVNLINPYDNKKESATESALESQPPSLNLIFDTAPKGTQKIEEKSEFQAKFKDVHTKLSSQLSNGPNPKKPLKQSYSSASSNTDGESLILSTSPITSPSAADLKKQKKSTTPQSSPQKSMDKGSATKNWFLNRLNKTTSSTRSSNGFHTSALNTPAKCKQSEKENLLNASDNCDGYDNNDSNLSSNPASPILKSSASSIQTNSKSKVNMIINQLEASGHLPSIFSADAASKFCSFGDNDCNNYEPIMTVSSPPSSFMKKV